MEDSKELVVSTNSYMWVADVLFFYLTEKFIFQCYAADMPIIIVLLRAFSTGSWLIFTVDVPNSYYQAVRMVLF
jgi:hypothetical protein